MHVCFGILSIENPRYASQTWPGKSIDNRKGVSRNDLIRLSLDIFKFLLPFSLQNFLICFVVFFVARPVRFDLLRFLFQIAFLIAPPAHFSIALCLPLTLVANWSAGQMLACLKIDAYIFHVPENHWMKWMNGWMDGCGWQRGMRSLRHFRPN